MSRLTETPLNRADVPPMGEQTVWLMGGAHGGARQ